MADSVEHEDSQLVRLGLNKRTCEIVGKHTATNDQHLKQLIARLDENGDKEAADTIAWLVWHIELKGQLARRAWDELAKSVQESETINGQDNSTEKAELAVKD